MGKVSISKSLLLPKLIYIFSILPPPSEFVALIETIYKLLWKGPDKITRKAAINSFDNGGLNLTDLETSIKMICYSMDLKSKENRKTKNV